MREAFAEDPRLRAVGEIGLDFYWKDCPPFIQEEAFRVQLALAKETDRPVVIHSRDAAKDTLRILEAEGFSGRPVLWHCFSGDAVDFLDRFLAQRLAHFHPRPRDLSRQPRPARSRETHPAGPLDGRNRLPLSFARAVAGQAQ